MTERDVDLIWTSATRHEPNDAAVTFGRGRTCLVRVGDDPVDTAVSRKADEFRRSAGSWIVENIGSRTIFVVEAGRELALLPTKRGRSEAMLNGGYGWIRLPGSNGDHAIQFRLGVARLAAVSAAGDAGTELTDLEDLISITDNERRSVVAVYEHYLQLPPHYRREPRSFRAAAARLGAEEGKVKADLRRAQSKVVAAGGPELAGNRARDTLFEWLCGHGVVGAGDRELLTS